MTCRRPCAPMATQFMISSDERLQPMQTPSSSNIQTSIQGLSMDSIVDLGLKNCKGQSCQFVLRC